MTDTPHRNGWARDPKFILTIIILILQAGGIATLQLYQLSEVKRRTDRIEEQIVQVRIDQAMGSAERKALARELEELKKTRAGR